MFLFYSSLNLDSADPFLIFRSSKVNTILNNLRSEMHTLMLDNYRDVLKKLILKKKSSEQQHASATNQSGFMCRTSICKFHKHGFLSFDLIYGHNYLSCNYLMLDRCISNGRFMSFIIRYNRFLCKALTIS